MLKKNKQILDTNLTVLRKIILIFSDIYGVLKSMEPTTMSQRLMSFILTMAIECRETNDNVNNFN